MSAYFNSYQCFDDENKADDIIHEAIEKLKAEMTDQAKAVIAEYAVAKAQKERLEAEIEKLKTEAEDLKAYYQRLNSTELPKEFVQNMVKTVSGDYAPWDKAWMIKESVSKDLCPYCYGKTKINIKYCDTGKLDEIECPRCKGKWYVVLTKRSCEEVRVREVNVKLNFDSHAVRYWTTDTIEIQGMEYPVSADRVYPTIEDAKKALKKMEAKEK